MPQANMGDRIRWRMAAFILHLALIVIYGIETDRIMQDVVLKATDTYLSMQNGFVHAIFNLSSPGLSYLAGDFGGRGHYGGNTLMEQGVVMERELCDGSVLSSGTTGAGAMVDVILSDTPDCVSVQIKGIVDDVAHSSIMEEWTLSLERGSRSLLLEAQGHVLPSPNENSPSTKAVRRVIPMRPTSIYALYETGIVQMKGEPEGSTYYASKDPLPLLYSLGGWGKDLHMAGNLSLSIERAGAAPSSSSSSSSSSSPPPSVTLISSCAFGNHSGYTSFQDVIIGDFRSPLDTWGGGWKNQSGDGSQLPNNFSWKSLPLKLYPNNADFPLHTLSTGPNLPSRDLEALLTGIYASPVGNIDSHMNEVEVGYRVAQMATTTHMPDVGYAGLYSFFDPDNYFSTGAILASGQPYLQDQVRQVLERSGEFLSPTGQVPHHFEGITPVYVAISGQVQPGPNIFWILSCFNYVKVSGNLIWLENYMPTLRRASAFLFDMLQSDYKLVKAPGSLFIDVFLRGNLTTDTNAMLVGFFEEFGDAEEAVGNVTRAHDLRQLAESIRVAINQYLWHKENDDHYITQLNLDGSTRDFVDYDANLLAIAHGIADHHRASKVLARVDRNKCSHGRATWVSEKFYGPNETANGNTGDSACSMARIGWYDALARRRTGDLETFDKLILNPLREDLIRWTWMHERYGCDGLPQLHRTNAYFEYPSLVAMLIREIRYGINLGLLDFMIKPFGPTSFSYHVGNVYVKYSKEHVFFEIPGQGSRRITVTGLMEDAVYRIEVSQCYVVDVDRKEGREARTSLDGTLRFETEIGDEEHRPCRVSIRHTAQVPAGKAALVDERH